MGNNNGGNTLQSIERLECPVANLGTIMEANRRWAQSENPVVNGFGVQRPRRVGSSLILAVLTPQTTPVRKDSSDVIE